MKRENNAVLIHLKLLGKKFKGKERGESTKAKEKEGDAKIKRKEQKTPFYPFKAKDSILVDKMLYLKPVKPHRQNQSIPNH